MNRKSKHPKTRSGYVHARLTPDEQTQVQARCDASGMTVSDWVRNTLLEALKSSPQEHRLMTFMAAQTASIRVAMEQWQSGKQLTDTAVQASIEKLAAEAAQTSAERMARRLEAVEKMEAA